MIIDNIEKIKNLRFEKVEDEERYFNYLIVSFEDVIDTLEKNKEKLAIEQANESGKPVNYCNIEITRCIVQLNQATKYLRNRMACYEKSNTVKYIPIGVVLAITTFSSPYSSFFHKFLPAMICGNLFVFVPSPKVCKCSIVLFNLIEQCMQKNYDNYDISKRMICVDTQYITGVEIIEHLKFDYILFTGKSETASLIKKQIGYKHGVFETGSNALAYVDATIKNIDYVAEQLVKSAFAQSGMRCIGLKNLFIQKEISDSLINEILSKAKKIQSGNALNLETMVGPIYDNVVLTELLEYISLLKQSGYSILLGGYVKDGNILLPTILVDNSNSFCSVKEMYGPVLCVHVVNDFKEIEECYYRRSSLNTALFSNNMEEIQRFVKYCDTCGTICINCGPDKRDDELPFGGLFDENDGKEDLESLVRELSVCQQIIYKA